MDEHGYKNPGLGCPSALLCPAATLWPSQHTLAKREEGGEEEGGKRKYRSRYREEDREITGAGADDTARHGFRSYTASTLHCTAILSPSTPMVSLPASPCSPPDLTVSAKALHIVSVRPRPSPATGYTRTAHSRAHRDHL